MSNRCVSGCVPAVMKGTIRDNQPMLEADIYSDTGTVVGESDTDHCETDM